MNHEQWTKLLEATKGHTPGPWIERGFNHVWGKYEDATLAAAAPDLLAEVERLRGWLRVIVDRVSIRSDTLTEKQIKDALNGAEVPK